MVLSVIAVQTGAQDSILNNIKSEKMPECIYCSSNLVSCDFERKGNEDLIVRVVHLL